jgi:hypothetical protein
MPWYVPANKTPHVPLALYATHMLGVDLFSGSSPFLKLLPARLSLFYGSLDYCAW